MKFIPLLLTALVLSVCDDPKAEAVPGEYAATGEVIAKVGEAEVHQDLVDVLLERLPAQQRQQLEQAGQIDQLSEQVVLTEVLYQEALKQNLHQEKNVQTSIAFATRSAMADALVAREVKKRITPERIEQYYKDHLVQYAKPEAKISHIVVPEEEKAAEIAAQIQGGADFAALAAEHSIDPRTKAAGGSLGDWVPIQQIQGEIGTALKTGQPGQVLGPFQMGPGMFSIIKVDERRDQTPLAEVEDQIRGQLDRELTEEYIKELQEAATIERMGEKADAGGPGGAILTPPPGGAPAAPAAPAAPDGQHK